MRTPIQTESDNLRPVRPKQRRTKQTATFRDERDPKNLKKVYPKLQFLSTKPHDGQKMFPYRVGMGRLILLKIKINQILREKGLSKRLPHYRNGSLLLCPDFECERTLVQKHSKTGDDPRTRLFCRRHKGCFERTVDQIGDRPA